MSVTQMYIVYYNTGRYGAAAVSYVFSTIMPSLVDSSSSSDDEVDFLRHYESSQQQQRRQQLLLCLKVNVLKLRS